MLKKNAISFCLIAGAITLIAGLVGCGSPDDGRNAEISDKDEASWRLPLDPYTVTDLQSARSTYASTLLTTTCMADAGFFGASAPFLNDEALAPHRARNFNVEFASTWGYGLHTIVATPAQKAWYDWNFSSQTFDFETPAVSEQFTKCRDEATQRTLYGTEASGYAPDLARVAQSKALSAEEVQSAAAKWVSCMAPQGIEDLPRLPIDMPSASLVSKQELRSVAAAPAPEEIRVATFDAQCRISSGFRATYYDELWKQQVTIVKKNYDKLEDIKDTIAKHSGDVDEIIAENAAHV